MNTYLYSPKPTLVIKKLGKGAKIQADSEEKQLLRETENARIYYHPDLGILVEVDNQQGIEEVENLFIEKKLPLMHEGEELLLESWRYLPEVPDATGATGNHV